MARTTRKTAVKKTAKPAPAVEVEETDEVVEEDEAGSPKGLDRVLNRDAVQPNWSAFSEFIVEHGGPKINPKHVGIVLTGYKFFQRSDSAVTAREQAAAQKAELQAEREAAREARAKEREAKATEREERKAEREAAAKDKAARAKKTAAAASAPAAKKTAAKATPKASAGKATAKKTAVKKSAAKKAAF